MHNSSGCPDRISPSFQKHNSINAWAAFTRFAGNVVEALPEAELNKFSRLLQRLDGPERILRGQSWREHPLLPRENVEIAQVMMAKENNIKDFKDINKIIKKIQTRRWAIWHVAVAKGQLDTDKQLLIKPENGMPLFEHLMH